MIHLSLDVRRIVLAAALLAACFSFSGGAARAQTTPQRVFEIGSGTSGASQFSVFNKSSSGALSAVAGSPFPASETGLIAADGKGRFLFLPGQTSIHMYSIDAGGALTEVPRSPFPYIPTTLTGPPPAGPLSIVTEPTGKYVYVGFATGSTTGFSTLVSYVIDISNPSSPVLDYGGYLDFPEQPLNLFISPNGRHLYRTLGHSNDGYSNSDFAIYDLDASSGGLFGPPGAFLTGSIQHGAAMDPQGRFMYQAFGTYGDWFTSLPIDPTNGSLKIGSSYFVGYGQYGIDPLVAEPTGKFLYANLRGQLYILPVDQAGNFGTPTILTVPALPVNQTTVVDPQGPYFYTADVAKLRGFQADAITGVPIEIAGSPFTDGTSANSTSGSALYITNTQAQAVSGPYLELISSGNFPATNVGQISPTIVTVAIINIGNQPLAFTSIAMAGDTTNSFTETNNCLAALAPGTSCQASISFMPTVAGQLAVSLQVTSNAPGSPQGQSVVGTGVGNTTSPQASFFPPNLNSGSQTQGTTGSPQTITLTNSGTAPLHVSGISLAGSNPTNWSQTNTCTAAIAPQATCTISVTFSPVDNGILTALLNVTDDALNSPQVINIYGNAPPAAQILPATVGGNTSSTVPAGHTAMFNLQVTPNAGFTGMMSFSCSGVPTGAQCNVPASFTVSNGASTQFTVSVSTSGSAAFVLPGLRNSPPRTLPEILILPLLLCLLFAAWMNNQRSTQIISRPALRWQTALASLTLFVALSGCGGGGSATIPPPPPVITPSGTYIITVTPSATATGSTKALALTPIKLSLIVK